MSRPQKMHKPIKGGFNNILALIAQGTGKAKLAAKNMERHPKKASTRPAPKKPD